MLVPIPSRYIFSAVTTVGFRQCLKGPIQVQRVQDIDDSYFYWSIVINIRSGQQNLHIDQNFKLKSIHQVTGKDTSLSMESYHRDKFGDFEWVTTPYSPNFRKEQLAKIQEVFLDNTQSFYSWMYRNERCEELNIMVESYPEKTRFLVRFEKELQKSQEDSACKCVLF